MSNLILHPTDMSQWYALVNEAQLATHLLLTENTESYLVFLLMRFSHQPRLLESIVALDFLHSRNKPRQIQTDLLREVGDKSLLFCGLFPGVAEKRHVNLSYFTQMGQAAYLTIGELQDEAEDDLYCQLGMQFTDLQQVLQAMRSDHLKINSTQWGIILTPISF